MNSAGHLPPEFPAGHPVDAVYIAYWSLRDPLCQSQSLPVARALAARGWRLGLMTFEQPRWAVAKDDVRGVAGALRREGISWQPTAYHKRPPVLSTVFDVAHGAWICYRNGAFRRARLFHGRGTVANAIAYLASRLTGALYLDDADGPLSEEYVDAGVWRRGSAAHRLTRWAEGRFLRTANAVAVLTARRREEVAPLARASVTVLPCGVDTDHFAPRPGEAERLRRALALRGTVLVYSGKAGGWYRADTVVEFARAVLDVTGEVTLLVLTTEDPAIFLAKAAAAGVRCVVREASREDMPSYLSAADAGLSFRLETPSQRACSPVKNGEYLACGLPVVTTPGAGDYSELVEKRHVGVVLPALDAAGLRRAAEDLVRLLGDPELSTRCRRTAREEVDLREVVVPRYFALYETLLGAASVSPV